MMVIFHVLYIRVFLMECNPLFIELLYIVLFIVLFIYSPLVLGFSTLARQGYLTILILCDRHMIGTLDYTHILGKIILIVLGNSYNLCNSLLYIYHPTSLSVEILNPIICFSCILIMIYEPSTNFVTV